MLAIPVKKPVITALEMKRVKLPSLNTPSRSWNSPTRMVSVTNTDTCSAALTPTITPPTASIMALVRAQFMNWELVNRPATGIPTIMELKAETGFTPARIADAIESGMATMASVRPAPMSLGTFLSSKSRVPFAILHFPLPAPARKIAGHGSAERYPVPSKPVGLFVSGRRSFFASLAFGSASL